MEAQKFIDYHYLNHAKKKRKVEENNQTNNIQKKKEISVIINVLIKRDI